MLSRYRYILMLYLILVCSVKVVAVQLAMPDNVYIGTTKHYSVDPNPIPGSTYIWKVDGVIQLNSTTNEIDIAWNKEGTYLLEVQEMNLSTCYGAKRTGQVIVNQLPIVIPSADLSVLKTVNNTHPIIGQVVVFTIVATNHGADNATGVIVTDILQSGYSFISSTTTSGKFDAYNAIWTIGNLNVGKSETLTISTVVNTLGNYSNTAIIAGIEVDAAIENNTSTVITYPTDFLIPDGFSPNEDGINDLFVIRGITNYSNNTFVIFNRWGNKVFQASPYKNTWDGHSMFGLRVGGDELPVGTYFYVLDLKDGSPIFKGTIYLNR